MQTDVCTFEIFALRARHSSSSKPTIETDKCIWVRNLTIECEVYLIRLNSTPVIPDAQSRCLCIANKGIKFPFAVSSRIRSEIYSFIVFSIGEIDDRRVEQHTHPIIQIVSGTNLRNTSKELSYYDKSPNKMSFTCA